VATYFFSNKVDTYDSLREWLKPEVNRDAFRRAGKLGPFFKVGDKTADYFRVLVGHSDAIAVDRGQRQLLADAHLVPLHSITISYKEKRSILQLTALAMNCRPIDLDKSIYDYYVSTNKMKQASVQFPIRNNDQLKFCHNCGCQLLVSDGFCTKCGAKQH